MIDQKKTQVIYACWETTFSSVDYKVPLGVMNRTKINILNNSFKMSSCSGSVQYNLSLLLKLTVYIWPLSIPLGLNSVVDQSSQREFQYKIISCICNWKIFHEGIKSFTSFVDLVSIEKSWKDLTWTSRKSGYAGIFFVEANSIFQSDYHQWTKFWLKVFLLYK
jgi:hypothetical protein